MSRPERLARIERLLRNRGVVARRELLAELEISRATLKRDLEFLRSRLGAPIEYDAGAGGYRLANARGGAQHELPGLWFDESELYSLLMAHQLLTGLDSDGLLARHLQPLLERIQRLLGATDSGSGAAAWLRRVRVQGAMHRPVAGRFFQKVAEALLTRRRLHLRYLTRRRGESGERNVSPQRLVHYRNTWYVDAWCHRVEGLRRFALDAIEEASLLEHAATEVPLAEVEAAMDAGYGVFAGVARERRWATLRFDHRAARWARHEQWHPDQQGSELADGGYVLRVPYVDDTELVMDILRQGEQVEVLAPAALRRAVQLRLHAAARQYADDHAT